MAEWYEGRWICGALTRSGRKCLCPPIRTVTSPEGKRCKKHGAFAGRKKRDGTSNHRDPVGYKNSVDRHPERYTYSDTVPGQIVRIQPREQE